MNNICQNRTDLHIMNEDELNLVHDCYLSMARDIFNCCDRNGITAMLCGGSVLGAIRHDGFIPWDDDMDIHMPREDYEKFKKRFDGELGKKYRLIAPNYRGGSSKAFARVEMRPPVITDTRNNTHGLMIDIFPSDNAPDNYLKRLFWGVRSEIYIAIASQVKYFETTDKTYANEMFGNTKHKWVYYAKKTAGWLFHWRTANKWYDIADRKCVYPHNDTQRIAIPSGRKHYFGEIYPRNGMVHTIIHSFETEHFPIPVGWEVYLNTLYGDWKTIPSEDRREKHWIKDIRFIEK